MVSCSSSVHESYLCVIFFIQLLGTYDVSFFFYVLQLWSLRNGSQIRNVWLESAVSALEWGPKEDRAFAGTYNGDIYEINTQSEVY